MAGSAATNVPGTVVAVYNLARNIRPSSEVCLQETLQWQQKQNDRFEKVRG